MLTEGNIRSCIKESKTGSRPKSPPPAPKPKKDAVMYTSATLTALRALQDNTDADVFIVGGFVRDFLRGQPNGDMDIIVRNLPIAKVVEYLKAFGKVKHVTLAQTNDLFNVKIYLFKAFGDSTVAEIVLPRRGKEQVADHTNTLEQDYVHRDFTFNAMYLPIYFKSAADVIDISGGRESINTQTIIANGNPEERIIESPIRMLRAISLASRLGYEIDTRLKEAIFDRAGLISRCPADAVRAEINDILLSTKPSRYIRLMYELGLLRVTMPELHDCYGVTQNKRFHKYDVFGHCVHACDNIDPEITLRLAALLHDIGKPACKVVHDDGKITFHKHEIPGTKLAYQLMTRLNYDKATKNAVSKLIRLHMYHYTREFTDVAVRRLMKRIGITCKDIETINQFPLFKLRSADRLGNGYKDTAVTQRQLDMESRMVHLLKESTALSITDLDISGSAIIEHCGCGQGPIIGQTLRHLLSKVLEDPQNNGRQKLLELAEEFISQT